MSYLTVIPLADAKTYLGVDDTSRDAEITRIIKAALGHLEKRTNIHVEAKDKTYHYSDSCVRVYDYPINTATPTGVTKTDKGLYSIFETTDTTVGSIVLNVGFTDETLIDPDFIQIGFDIIEHLFQGENLKNLPELIVDMIDSNRRFII